MPSALLILAPRQPERFGEVERLARDAGFVTARRSELPIDAEPRADVVVLDTIGELAQLYQLATAVFVGGSLVDHGGHNILEPAIFGKPIVFGPHMQNFKEIADAFLANGAAVQVQSERELDEALLALVTDPVRRARLGAAARALVEANRGAKDKTLAVIAELLPPARRHGRRASSVPSDWCIDSDTLERGRTARRPRGGAAWYARDPVAAAPAARVRSSASATCASAAAARRRSSRTSRGCCVDARRAPGDPDARLRPPRSRATASRSSPTARASSPASTRPATSR